MPEYNPDKHCGAGADNPERAKGPCRREKGWGTDHPGIGRCKLHGGATASHSKAARQEMIVRECDRLGIPVEIDAAEGLLRSIAVANGNIIFYQALVNELPIHPGPDTFVMTGDGGYWERGAPGLYGRTYHVSGVPTGEAKESILVQMLDKERTRFEALCIAALKLNLDERQIEAAKAIGEAQAQMVAALIRAIFGDPQLGLSADQVRVALGVAAQHLRGLSQPGLTAG